MRSLVGMYFSIEVKIIILLYSIRGLSEQMSELEFRTQYNVRINILGFQYVGAEIYRERLYFQKLLLHHIQK